MNSMPRSILSRPLQCWNDRVPETYCGERVKQRSTASPGTGHQPCPERLRRWPRRNNNAGANTRLKLWTCWMLLVSHFALVRCSCLSKHSLTLSIIVDPEVSALSTLTNVQNSLFVPNLGGWVNRMPTYQLTRHPPSDEEQGTITEEGEMSEDNKLQQRPTLQQLRPFTSMSSVLPGPRYAVLPENHELEGWTREDFMELNDHVRHMLHSRRSKFKRSMKGFGQYVRKRMFQSPHTCFVSPN